MSFDNSAEEQRQRNILIGNAANVTATLVARAEDPVKEFCENLDTIIGRLTEAHGQFAIATAFPGTTVVQDPFPAGPVGGTATPNVVQFPQQPQAAPQQQYVPQAGPAPVPGATNGGGEAEANWQAFFNAWNNNQVAPNFAAARQGQWFDNRAGKSASAPDFKVKGAKGEQGLPAVWVTGKGTPSWVAGALRQAGLA